MTQEFDDKLDAFLRGELPPGELQRFDNMVAADPALRHELEVHQSMVAALASVRRAELKQRLKDIDPQMLQVASRAIVDAIPVVCLLGFLIGAIIAFQTLAPMARYGAQLQVAQIVGVSMIRELGPLMTAIILAGRTGSAFAAEIGTMKVTEEIDALKTFGLDPVRFLVIPRMAPVTLLMPLLSVFTTLMGVLGGYVVMSAHGFSLGIYLNTITNNMAPHDFLQGLLKAMIFGMLVTGTGCHSGLLTLEGPGAVGASTTRAVVSGIVMVVVADGILGALFYTIGI